MRRLAQGALLLMTVWIYFPVHSAQSVYEDDRSLAVSVHQLTLPTPVSLLQGRDATTISFGIVNAMGGVRAQHLVNVGFHLLNGILLWYWLEVIGLPLLAVAGGVTVLLLHPLAVESVAYISARTELLAAMGLLIALHGVIRREWYSWWLIVAGLLIAIMAKESAAITVVLVLLFARMIKRLKGEDMRYAIGGIAIYAVGRWYIALWNDVLWQADRGGLGYAATQATIVWSFLWRTIMPWSASFTVDHDWFWVTPAIGLPALIAFLMALIACACFARRAPRLALACAWPLLAVCPRLIVRLPEWLNEHQWYVPLVGCAWLTAELVSRWTTLIALTPAQYAALDVEDD